MNSCVRCWFETGVHTGGTFMYQGNSLCARHLDQERPAAAETSEEELDGLTLKWSKGPADKD